MQPERTIANFQEFEGFLSRFTNYERVPPAKLDTGSLGLARMRRLVRELAEIHLALPTVHIAGTKGKGSTTIILDALLRAEGFRVGTYTSPHVEHLRERIRVDGEPAQDALLVEETNRMLPVLDRLREEGPSAYPSFFELMTALAMVCFKACPVDWAIFEVGLGGRLDATNVLEPRFTCITSIGLEHTQQLGKTLGKIAGEKAGIVKPRTPLLIGPLPDEAREVILGIARERSAPVTILDEGLVTPAGPGRVLIRGLGEFPAGAIRGPALRTDLGLALMLERQVLATVGRQPSRSRVEAALASLVLPARVELFAVEPEVVLDAAHTAESIRALKLTLDEIQLRRPRTLVFSIAAGKNLTEILQELPGIAEDAIWTLADPIRSIPPEELLGRVGHGTAIRSTEEALGQALGRGWPVVVTGSFYLAGALRPVLRSALRSSQRTDRKR